MRHFLLVLPLLTVLLTTACQKPDAPLVPSYEGQYALQVTADLMIDNYPVHSVSKGTLSIVRNADGTYTFTEKLPLHEDVSYQVTLVGKTFALPTITESIPLNGVTYRSQSTGTGEFKTTGSITNSVTIIRTTAFDAGSYRVNRTYMSFGYH